MITLLSAQDLRVQFGERTILDGVAVQLQRGERVALLGHNGAGKTTLLRVLLGTLKPDEGQVWWAAGLRMAEFKQQRQFPAGLSVDSLLRAADPYQAERQEWQRLSAELADPESFQRWAALDTELHSVGAHDWPVRLEQVRHRLALETYGERQAITLSGGEQTRLALALALLQEPDLLLLDEPTNHLDIRMREWLEKWLLSFTGGLLLTSHDRDFLDAVATRSLWLEHGQLSSYPGGYSRALAQRTVEQRTQWRAAQRGERERQRLGHRAQWLSRRGQRARALKSRARRVELVDAPLPERQLRMRLLSGQSHAPIIAWGERLHKRYGVAPVLRQVAFKLRQGDRVLLLGPNGSGKSTLLRLLAGVEQPDPGSPPPLLQVAQGASVVYLDQQWHGLDSKQPLRAQFERRFGASSAATLGAAGLSEAHWEHLPAQLSGGERARAGLALVGRSRADLLLLDEPTNHLDLEGLQALQAAIQAYSGAVVLVTHDRRLAREVATRLWLIEDGQLYELEHWGSEAYLDPARTLDSDPPPPLPPPSPRFRMVPLEHELQRLHQQLDLPPGRWSGREEARLRAQAHQCQQALYELWSEVFSAPSSALYDAEVREPPLRVRAERLSRTEARFWAAADETCPQLHWNGERLIWQDAPPHWYGVALLGGALRILFERWQVPRVRLGQDGPWLRCGEYFQLVLGTVRASVTPKRCAGR